jgi:hypothetical protein
MKEKTMTGTHSDHPYGQLPEDEPSRMPRRRKRKTLRHHFCDGIEAAVKAEPEAFKSTKPSCMLSLMVKGLVSAAANARCDCIKMVMNFLNEAEFRRSEAAFDAEGNFDLEVPPEPRLDWQDGVWDSSERTDEYLAEEERKKKEEEDKEARCTALRAELREKFLRAAEADRLNAERKARIEAERQGLNPPPAAPAAPNSGNNPPSPDRRTIRVGGRIVEG